jgi:ketosteroid isomerase-like protein
MTADDVIKGICTASAAGDFAGVAAHFASDAVVFGTLGGVDQEVVLHGPDAVVRYFADVAATWDEWRVEAERVLRNGDVFVVFWHETARSRELETHNETATVFTVRDGKVVEARGYLDRAAALEAAGLS